MSVHSPRRRALRRYTWVLGAASMFAGAAIYLQVSGAAAALAAVTDSLGPSDPGLNGTVDNGGGSGGYVPQGQPPQYGNPGNQQPPIAVTGSS